MTGGFSKKSIFINIIFISQKLFWKIFELVFLEFKHIYKTQRTSLFSFYLFIFYSLFRNNCVYQLSPPFCTFLLHVNTQNGSALVLLAISESLYVIMLSTFCDCTGSLKRTPTWNFMLSIFHVNYLDET